jgi:imidazolonepropionase-like amidohydrolase
MHKFLFLVLLFLTANAAGQTNPTTYLRCGAMVDPAGQVRKNVVITVEGDRIREVGTATVPAGGTVVDLSRETCLPGLIDAHTHIIIAGALNEEQYLDQLMRQSVPYRAIVGTQNAKRALESGFTTIRDVGVETAAGYPDVDVKRAINDGVVPGPRMQAATRAIGVIGAYPMRTFAPEIHAPQNIDLIDGPERARLTVREQIAAGADLIKAYSDRGPLVLRNGVVDDIPTFTPEEIRAIVDEAHRERKKVATHASALQGVHNAVEAGVDSVEHGL